MLRAVGHLADFLELAEDSQATWTWSVVGDKCGAWRGSVRPGQYSNTSYPTLYALMQDDALK